MSAGGIGTTSVPTLSAREEDVMKEYSSSLEDLTVNSKPLINMLTMLADENSAFASVIVLAIEKHLQKVPSDIKLPVLYLIDSIMKNVGRPYPALFTQNIVSTFCGVFEKVDEKTRAQMFKLRHTWNNMFPAKKMYALDARVNAIDPAWPISASPPTSTSIHLNPKFLQVKMSGMSTLSSEALIKKSTKVSSSSSKSDSGRAESKRSSRSQRKAAAIAAAVAANSSSITTTVAPITTMSAPVTAGSVSAAAQKNKPCAPVAPVVSTPVLPVARNKTINSLDVTCNITSSNQQIRIAPVSTQLIKATIRSRDPRLLRSAANSEASNQSSVSTTINPHSVTMPLHIASSATCSTVSLPVSTVTPPVSVVAPLQQLPVVPHSIATTGHMDSMSNTISTAVTTLSLPISTANTTILTTTIATTTITSTTTSSITSAISTAVTCTSSVVNVSNAINKHSKVLVDPSSSDLNKLPSSTLPKSKLPFSSQSSSSALTLSSLNEVVENKKVKQTNKKLDNKFYSQKERKEKKDYHRSKENSNNNSNSSGNNITSTKHKKDVESHRRDKEINIHKEKPIKDNSKLIESSFPSNINISGGNVNTSVSHNKQKSGKIKFDKKLDISKDDVNNSSEKVNKNTSNIIKNIDSSDANESSTDKSPKKSFLREQDDKKISSPRSSPRLPPVRSPRSKSSKHGNKSPSVRSLIKNVDKIISQEEKDDVSLSPPPSSTALNESSDKFKEMKASSLKRMKTYARHREPSLTPPPATITTSLTTSVLTDQASMLNTIHSTSATGDTDLRVPPSDDLKKSVVTGLELGKDVDLRALAASGTSIPSASELLPQTPKRPSEEREIDVPPMKKSKMDKFDALFGREDTDMRQELAPPLPSPPPPPIISPLTEVDENNEERSWAKYKQGKPDIYKSLHRHSSREESFEPYRRSRQLQVVDRLGRPLLYHHRSPHGGSGGGGNQYSRSGRHRGDQLHYENESSRSNMYGNFKVPTHYNYILREAEEQYKSGTMPMSTYNRVVKEVISMNEQKKLDEAIRRDEQESNHWKRRHRDSLSPATAAAYDNNTNMLNADMSDYEYKGSASASKKMHISRSGSNSPSKGVSSDIRTESISTPRKMEIGSKEEDVKTKSDADENKQLNESSESHKNDAVEFDQPVSLNYNLRQIQQSVEGSQSSIISDVMVSKLEGDDVKSKLEHPSSIDSASVSSNVDNSTAGEFEVFVADFKEDAEPLIEVKACEEEKLGNEEKLSDIKSVTFEVTEKSEGIADKDESSDDNKAKVQEQKEKSADIDARIKLPHEFIKDNEPMPSLLPPPFPEDMLTQFTADQPQPSPPVLPDPAIIASKDTDLRIGQRPIGAMVGVLPSLPLGIDIEPPKCIPMDTEYSDVQPRLNPDLLPEMEFDHSGLSTSDSEIGKSSMRNRLDVRNHPDSDQRLFQPSKKVSRFSDIDTDKNQGKLSPPGPSSIMMSNNVVSVAPWDQTTPQSQMQQPPSTNVSGPGIGQGPWMRPLLRPPPAMLLRAGMEPNRFNPHWPSNPPMMQNIPQPQLQQIPPIRPPPPPPASIFEPEISANVRFTQHFPRPPTFPGPPLPGAPVELPPADPMVLDMIAADTMRTINIDGVPREIRYYGETAVVMMSWDDPREIMFQGTPRRVTVNDKDSIVLSFNGPFREFMIDDQPHRIRFGGPTRELCIDNTCYECFFGGPPINVDVGGKLCKIQLEGPPPQVRIGNKRADLVVGKVNLIVDAREMFPIFLDPKPQRFDIDGVPYIFRFVEALETVVINGHPVKVEFGGLPKPIYSRGKKYFIRFSALPRGIVPGYVNIINMEGGRRGSPPPMPPAPLPLSGVSVDPDQENSQDSDMMGSYSNPVSPVKHDIPPDEQSMPLPDISSDNNSAVETHSKQVTPEQSRKRTNKINPLDMLTSLIAPTVQTPVSGYSYSVETEPVEQTAQPDGGTVQATDSKPKENTIPFLNTGQINIEELFQRLVATGIVPGSLESSSTADKKSDTSEKSTLPEESATAIKPTDFHKPETLKIRQPGLISILFSGIQCSSCGVRFPPEQTIKYSQHLDWHFRQNRRERDSTRKAQSRKWYYDVSDWIQFEEIEDLEERAQSWFESQAQQNVVVEDETTNDIPSVACENGLMDVECEMCKDKFEQFYNEEKEEWHLKRAVKVDDKIYHPICYEDYLSSLKAAQTELEETKQEEAEESVICAPVDEEDDDVIIQEVEPKPVIIEIIKDDDEEEEEAAAAAALKAAEETAKLNETSQQINDSENSSDKKIIDDINLDNDNAMSESAITIQGELQSDNSTDIINNELKDDKGDNSTLSVNDILNVVKNIKQEPMDDVEEVDNIIDLERLVVKKEKIEEEEEENLLPEPVVDTTHRTLGCTIDGNVELDDSSSMMKTAPSKIKINISKPVVNQPPKESSSINIIDESSHDEVPVQPPTASAVIPLNLVEPLQPPPPGEEPCPLHLKPRLVGKKLTELPPVSKGTELSGLCSIM
ncbi:uncharacterized protein LOC142332584 isoform X2 [Lycorma delicatula]|uniref:uncharacterized protein LOC142332584 isoform X2 n=1 Tax=Lycorma delicatula TaxID=130591 RepID=UPI003F518F17